MIYAHEIPVFRREDFYDDYTKEVLPSYQRNAEELLDEITATLVEEPESYQHIRMDEATTEDGIGKLFTFTSYVAEEGLQIHYVGVVDE